MEQEFREEVMYRLGSIERALNTELPEIKRRLDKIEDWLNKNGNGKKTWEQALIETIRVLVAALLAALGLRVMQT
ncbi:MAG: hypothetical protein HPY58_12755 [Firmicutes bacterium]|nr:hypothetical protein [Bacillota bacterium]